MRSRAAPRSNAAITARWLPYAARAAFRFRRTRVCTSCIQTSFKYIRVMEENSRFATRITAITVVVSLKRIVMMTSPSRWHRDAEIAWVAGKAPLRPLYFAGCGNRRVGFSPQMKYISREAG